ncbi:putative SNAP25 homologous protein SNAP30 [Humulus lupulus]|uniref:putative SNAP25 homologous protein SNAP30 n=1 Tax=Humulus lupulus TaxID=3486 RepID=UPI002B4010BD|nr:putative SNAP25 homologous protein SNAP30 [Humulus lupulus]XP_062111326.1 putative SNAP25 homologous protein SNAP30 [Humulus lupulus]
MFGFMKLPANKISKQKSVDPGFSATTTNPIDSDNKDSEQNIVKPARRTSSEQMLIVPDFEDDTEKRRGDRYKNDFRDSGGIENKSVQELEKYALYKAEETTKSVNNCLKIAEDIREDATRTLEMLDQQGEQITRTHMMAVDIDKDLSRGEKLLNNLGGMFSKTWKPKKTRDITGPLTTADNASKRSENNLEQRQKFGLEPVPTGRSVTKTPLSETTGALQKVEVEKTKQDDALSDLSNILGDLKNMAVDMGSELNRQNKALDHVSDDVDELNSRVKGANQRARRLIEK